MVSISLNAHNPETYQNVCRPEFENAYESVLEFVKKAKEEMDTEITTVVIPEVNIREVEETARKMGGQFRRREYLPLFW